MGKKKTEPEAEPKKAPRRARRAHETLTKRRLRPETATLAASLAHLQEEVEAAPEDPPIIKESLLGRGEASRMIRIRRS